MFQKNSFKVIILYFIIIQTSVFQSCDVAFEVEDPFIEKNKLLTVNNDITQAHKKDTVTVLSFEQFGQSFVENIPEKQQREALNGYSFEELFNLSSDKSNRLSFSNKSINAGIFKGRTSTIAHGERGYIEAQMKFFKKENGDIALEYTHISKSDHSNFPYFKIQLVGTLNTIIINPYNKNQDNSDFHIFGMVLTKTPYCAVGTQLADIRGLISSRAVSNSDRTITGACGNNVVFATPKEFSYFITEDPTAKLRSDFFTSFRKGTLLFFTFRISKDGDSQKLTLEHWLPPVLTNRSQALYYSYKSNFLSPYGTPSYNYPRTKQDKNDGYNYSEYEYIRVHATRTGFSRLISDFTNYFTTVKPGQVHSMATWRATPTGQVLVLVMDDKIDFS